MPRETHRPVALLSLATAVPPHILQQEEAKALARTLFGLRMRLFEQLEPVFDNAGIARRHIVRPVEWYHGDHGWKARNHVYLEAAGRRDGFSYRGSCGPGSRGSIRCIC